MSEIVDPSSFGDLLQYGTPGLLVVLVILLFALVVYLFKRLDQANTVKEAAVNAERERISADDKRKDKRIDDLVEKNDQLEKALDRERARRRRAEDGRAS